MLVVISDLHINDGTTCMALDQNSSTVFFMELDDQIQAAGFRPDGSYKNVESVDIILLGDIFDMIRTDRWAYKKDGSKENIRPWDSVEEYAPVVTEICRDIVSANIEFLKPFQDASKNGLTVENPITGESYNCKVNLFYMVGNHDWFPFVKDNLLDEVREIINSAFGISQTVFPWEIEEGNEVSELLEKACKEHRLYVQHGDKYDTINYHKFFGRAHSSLGDAIVIELINVFPEEVKRKLKEKFPDDELSPEFLKALDELDNVRPATHTSIYIRNIIGTLTPNHHKQTVKDIFDRCSKRAQNSGISSKVFTYDPVSVWKLQMLRLADKYSPKCIVRMVTRVVDMTATAQDKEAPKENWVKKGIADLVVYGHTHETSTPIGIGMSKDGHEKVYINSSTWKPLHIEITADPTLKEFPYFTVKNMVWFAAYKDGERKGRKYEVWNGQLGV